MLDGPAPSIVLLPEVLVAERPVSLAANDKNRPGHGYELEVWQLESLSSSDRKWREALSTAPAAVLN